MNKIYFFNTPTPPNVQQIESFFRRTVEGIRSVVVFPFDGCGLLQDPRGCIFLHTHELAVEALKQNGQLFQGCRIYLKFPWSSIDQLVKTKHYVCPPNSSEPEIRFNVFDRGECVTDLPGQFQAMSISGVSVEQKEKKLPYWQEVRTCARLFGEAHVKPHEMNSTMKAEILQMNFKQQNVGCHPFEQLITEMEIDKTVFCAINFRYELFVNSKGTLISNIIELRNLVSHLATKTVIGVDLEGYNRGVYRGNTSIIQISTDEDNFVIDACAHLMRLGIKTGLKSILENHKIWKVMVGLRSDNIVLQRDFSIYLYPVVELQIAIRRYIELVGACCLVCGQNPQYCKRLSNGQVVQECLQTSFDKICKLFFPEFNINKLPQKADWCIRPIPTDLLRYAVLDSALTLTIWDKMLKLFKEKSKPTDIYESVVIPSNYILLQLYAFDKEEADIERFVRYHFAFGDESIIAKLALQCRNYFAIITNLPVSAIIPDADLVHFVNSYTRGVSQEQIIERLRIHLDPERAIEFFESVHNKRLHELVEVVQNPIECSRCHQIGHPMGLCTNERVRTQEDRDKDKERKKKNQGKKRKEAGF